MGKARETVALVVMRFQCDDRGDWPEVACRQLLGAIDELHSGDCKKQPWTCCRCEAERAYAQTDEILRRLPVLKHEAPTP